MGKVFSPPKPKIPEKTAAEKELEKQQLEAAAKAKADSIKEMQLNLSNDTARSNGATGRRSLLSNSSTGYTPGLRSLLGG